MDQQGQLIRFAVIGLGHIGKRHVEMIRLNPEADLVAVADIQPEAQKVVEGLPFFTSLDDLLSQGPDFEVLCIATPNGWHEMHSLQALQAGKHIVIEKPMALSKAGCEKIIHTSLAQSKQVFCVMQNRYSPPSQWLKSLLEEKRLGEIFLVQVNCFWNRDDRYYKPGHWHGTLDMDGGPLFTQFSHFVDTLYWLLGDWEPIQASFSNFSHAHSTEFEDSGLIHFELRQGGKGSLQYSTAVWNRNLESSITLIGEKGSVKVGGQYMEEVQVCEIEDYEMPALAPTLPPNDYGGYKGSAANHRFIFENVVDVLKGRTTIGTNALEGMKVVEIIEKIYAMRPASLLQRKKA